MLALVLCSTLAFSSQVRLLTADETPTGAVAAEAAKQPADAPLADAPAANATPTEAQADGAPGAELRLGYHFAAGAAAAVVFVPVSLYLGSVLGSLSNNLIWAAIPVLLSIGLIPPLAVTISTVLAGNWKTPGRYRWWPAFLATMVINGVSLPLAASLGLSTLFAEKVLLYTLVQAVMQPGAAVLLERAWPREQQPTVLTVNDPVSPKTWFIPTGAWSF